MERCLHQIQIKIISSGLISWLPLENFDDDLMKDSHFKLNLAYVEIIHVKMIKDKFENGLHKINLIIPWWSCNIYTHSFRLQTKMYNKVRIIKLNYVILKFTYKANRSQFKLAIEGFDMMWIEYLVQSNFWMPLLKWRNLKLKWRKLKRMVENSSCHPMFVCQQSSLIFYYWFSIPTSYHRQPPPSNCLPVD